MPETPSAVRFFAVDHPSLPRTLRAKLSKRYGELMQQVADGYAKDWADYRERVGFARGVKEAMEICEMVEKDLGGDR